MQDVAEYDGGLLVLRGTTVVSGHPLRVGRHRAREVADRRHGARHGERPQVPGPTRFTTT
jgi:hypothetical protein